MVHRIFGWIGGYVKVRIQGNNVERFVNLCRNRGIILWQLYWEPGKNILYFQIALRDFYKLRPLVRKCRVHPIVVRRFGLPFLIGHMKKRASFCLGVALCFCLIIFLSTRIWGISIEGESYHTKDTIMEYLDSIDIYGGIAGTSLECSRLEEQIRQKYNDIGWVSVEKKGSKIYIRIKEVLLVDKEKKVKDGHLVAEEAGKVVSIVTRNGTAKVRAKDKVKKGQVLISGVVKIFGDNQEMIAKRFVHAEGNVVLSMKENYQDSLPKQYKKKVYTARTRSIHEWQFGDTKFFCYNPLKNLETYEKYDIIREGGKLCPFLSTRFPVGHYVKTFREILYQKAEYSKKEAGKVLQERFAYYLEQKKEAGYELKKQDVSLLAGQDSYQYAGTLVFWKKQSSYRSIQKKTIRKETDGNNGNGNRDTDGT